MKNIRISTVLLSVLAVCGCSGTEKVSEQFRYEWHYDYIDESTGSGNDEAALKIMDSYADVLEAMQEVIGYSDKTYSKSSPESPLSNFTADAIREAVEKESGLPVPIALTNMGGIRDDMPKGAVRMYDIYTIFPFENYLVLSEIKGSDLMKLFETMAGKNFFEAWSGVEITVKNKKIIECRIDGEPLDKDRVYNLATINFLADGGDGIRVGKYSKRITEYKDLMLRDVIVDKVREINATGHPLHMSKDGRIKVK